MKRLKVFSILLAVIALVFALGSMHDQASAKGKYKITKVTRVSNPKRYRVKGTIWRSDFKKKVTSKYRHKTTIFGTKYKAHVITPSGKHAIYYGVGSYIPQIDEISDAPLAGWTWHKNLYHKMSDTQRKKDIAFMDKAIDSLRTSNDRQRARTELKKVVTGYAYSGYSWTQLWLPLTGANMKKMAAEDFTPVQLVMSDAVSESDLIETEDADYWPVENNKFLVKVYQYFRPRIVQELVSPKRIDAAYRQILKQSKMSQKEYQDYYEAHENDSGFVDADDFSTYLYELINEFNRSNLSYKMDW